MKEACDAGATKSEACEILGVSSRTVERWETKPKDLRRGPTSIPSNALTTEERALILKIANSEEYANFPPGQIVPKLADKGLYVGSESSFYRVLKANGLHEHRSRSQPHVRARPEPLIATGPNQVWSWDITYLKAEIKGVFYYLYLPMDVFSRMIVHWEIHPCESAELASQMIITACIKQGVKRWQITLHSDNGGPMKGATMCATLDRLGVTQSLSRPRVSDDNPFSEALFKTLKFCPSFPLNGRFASIEAAGRWCEKFVSWYNKVHLHSAINWVTPASRHNLQDAKILAKRHTVYEEAKLKHPNRWSNKTRNWDRIDVVELNPERTTEVNKVSSCSQAS